ncbi:MAG TPA: hypothetical protein PKA48_09850 [Candidatus Obscuribacter sp.]|nr:hypothetical protein [Candidatus Obscuribacter sp.]
MFSYSSNRFRPRGQSSVELVAGLIILVPIVLVLFDLAVIVLGVQINDSTCREAARVASIGDPTDCDKRARAVVARANAQGSSMLSNFQMFSCTSTVTPAQVNAMKLNFGGPVSGTVTVVTRVDIHPFVVHYAYSGGAPITFQATQTYPFTYVVPNTAGGP